MLYTCSTTILNKLIIITYYFLVTKTTVLLSDINNAKLVNEVYKECKYVIAIIILNF